MSETTSQTDEAGWRRLLELAEAGEARPLSEHVESLSESDRIHHFGRLPPESRAQLLALLDPEHAAELLEVVPASHAAEAFEELSPDAAAGILEELASDDQADLLGSIGAARTEAILAQSPTETAESVRSLLRYTPDTAGGRMVTEFVAVPDRARVRDVIDQMRGNVDAYADYVVQYVYVVGSQGELRGVLPIRDLLLARAERDVTSLMISNPIRVPATASIDEVFDIFDRYAFVAVPVADESDRLVGVLLREDVDEARVDRADAQMRKARGIVGGEELRSLPLHIRSSRRLAWLSINILLNVAAASVIAYYEETLQAVIALAVFLPIISDMSGCSGNQAVAVSLRELSLGVTRPNEIARVLLKESGLGLINGIALGVVLGALAVLWKGNLALGLVVGGALALNTVVAVCIGGAVPLLIRRIGFDPALASGPMLTTATDMCGFFLVLSFATLALAQLTV